MMVFENRVQRKILGPERDEVIGEWMRQHNDLYCSPNIIRVIKSVIGWAGRVACLGGQERCVQSFGGETDGKRPLGRPRI